MGGRRWGQGTWPGPRVFGRKRRGPADTPTLRPPRSHRRVEMRGGEADHCRQTAPAFPTLALIFHVASYCPPRVILHNAKVKKFWGNRFGCANWITGSAESR